MNVLGNATVVGQCWEWTGSRVRSGYGQVGPRGHRRRAHRVVWELENGPIPDGMHVCHTCDNPPCVRPAHLFLGTAADNAHDRDRKGRAGNLRGEAHGSAKLTLAKVEEIRRRVAAGERHKALAVEFGVTRPAIGHIVTGRSWAA